MVGNETLLGSSAVYLFGRPLADVIIKPGLADPLGVPRKGANKFLQEQLERGLHQNTENAGLARIYAFAFEGSLYDLPRPAIFLVHGGGDDPEAPAPTNQTGNVEYKTLFRSPGSAARTGLGARSASFSLGMRVWVYDKGDFSMRLDIETGSFDQILLPDTADLLGATGGAMARSSGGFARSSGARSSGVMARSSGWTGRRGGDFD